MVLMLEVIGLVVLLPGQTGLAELSRDPEPQNKLQAKGFLASDLGAAKFALKANQPLKPLSACHLCSLAGLLMVL